MVCITSICCHCFTELRCVLPQHSFMSSILHKTTTKISSKNVIQHTTNSTEKLKRLPQHYKCSPFHVIHTTSLCTIYKSYNHIVTLSHYSFIISHSIHSFIQHIHMHFIFIQHFIFHSTSIPTFHNVMLFSTSHIHINATS